MKTTSKNIDIFENTIENFSNWIEDVYGCLSDDFWAEIYKTGSDSILDDTEEDNHWLVELSDKSPMEAAKIIEQIKELKK